MITRGYYDNGQLRYERSHHEGKSHGIMKWWYKDGQLWSEFSYREGQRHGIFKSYYHSGQPSYQIHYLYNNQVTREEYRRHGIIEKLSGL